jgi:ABC-type Fe3+-citrate transport system substrate-binding protein
MHLDSTVQIGIIAQEIEKILPQVVTTDKDGYKSVHYTAIIPVLIEAIKEQQKQIEELKQEISDIKLELNNQKKSKFFHHVIKK